MNQSNISPVAKAGLEAHPGGGQIRQKKTINEHPRPPQKAQGQLEQQHWRRTVIAFDRLGDLFREHSDPLDEDYKPQRTRFRRQSDVSPTPGQSSSESSLSEPDWRFDLFNWHARTPPNDSTTDLPESLKLGTDFSLEPSPHREDPSPHRDVTVNPQLSSSSSSDSSPHTTDQLQSHTKAQPRTVFSGKPEGPDSPFSPSSSAIRYPLSEPILSPSLKPQNRKRKRKRGRRGNGKRRPQAHNIVEPNQQHNNA